MAAALAFIKGLSALLSLLKEVVGAVRGIMSFIESNKNETWFQDSARFYGECKNARTNEEKKAAVQNIARLLTRM